MSLPVPPALPADLPEQASPEILGYLSNVLAEHIKADAVVGPRYLVPTVQSQLPLIDRLCQATRGPDHTEVLAVAAQFAEFCGWLYQDSGKPDSAVFWTNHALDYAQELNDPQLIAYIMMRKSNIATESGKPGYGLGLANAALNAFDVLTPRIRAVSLRTRANAQALLAERRDFEESVDQALIQASEAPPRKHRIWPSTAPRRTWRWKRACRGYGSASPGRPSRRSTGALPPGHRAVRPETAACAWPAWRPPPRCRATLSAAARREPRRWRSRAAPGRHASAASSAPYTMSWPRTAAMRWCGAESAARPGRMNSIRTRQLPNTGASPRCRT